MSCPPPAHDAFDKSRIADLVATHGSASATAWLEFDRYRIWRPPLPAPITASFRPVQGYMRRDPYIFAWGNPLVPSSASLSHTAAAFASWALAQNLRPVWCCVSQDFAQVLTTCVPTPIRWSTLSCIHEDIVDPHHVLALAAPGPGPGGRARGTDLKKNLKRADNHGVVVTRVRGYWPEGDRSQVEHGVAEWKRSRSGLQLASTALTPWIDVEHRRYWVARRGDKIVGLIILTPAGPSSFLIKNALSFPDAPKGTSETLIYTALKDLHAEAPHASVTFGITASDAVRPGDNISGWGFAALGMVYKGVVMSAGLLRRGDFRNKFDAQHKPMYVCYPEDGFGLDGINALLKMLKK